MSLVSTRLGILQSECLQNNYTIHFEENTNSYCLTNYLEGLPADPILLWLILLHELLKYFPIKRKKYYFNVSYSSTVKIIENSAVSFNLKTVFEQIYHFCIRNVKYRNLKLKKTLGSFSTALLLKQWVARFREIVYFPIQMRNSQWFFSQLELRLQSPQHGTWHQTDLHSNLSF